MSRSIAADPLVVFATILAIGSAAGITLGGNVLVSLGLFAVLTVTFALGLSVGRSERLE